MKNAEIFICQNCNDCILFVYEDCLYEYQPDNGKLFYADNDEPYEITGKKKEVIKEALFEQIK